MRTVRRSAIAVGMGMLVLLATAAGAMTFPKAEWVLVEKSARVLYLMRDGAPYRQYEIALGDNPSGPKTREGDERTPEGWYRIDARNPKSSFHLSLHVSYPATTDEARARALGVDPGGEIFIHGLPNGLGHKPEMFKDWDWTDGCIAVTNKAIEEIWHLVEDGTPIQIRP